MDQPSRQRARGIRTIGRLTIPSLDDVLLAQWPSGAMPGQRQDVAIASEWDAPSSGRSAADAGQPEQTPASLQRLISRYADQQRAMIHRILEAMDAELERRERLTLPFESPSPALDAIQSELDLASARCLLPPGDIETLRSLAATLGESVARLWALIDLYRAGHITEDELRDRRDLVLQRIETT
jgi:hypothetical protein